MSAYELRPHFRFKRILHRRKYGFIAAVGIALGTTAMVGSPQSNFSDRPDDPRAAYLTNADFGAMGDGVADDAPALQHAIDRVQETTHAGIVFVPEGRYRLGHTVNIWQGIRLIGYGAHRPVFVLEKNTPGFQQGPDRYMIQFADERPAPGAPFVDASEFTFYSGMSNIDFELEDGNPAAVAVRFRVAQHSALTHMDFRLGTARAAIEDVGNQASDIHVHGGEYGIITERTSPAWQFLLMDSSFDGQRRAAIQTHEAGFTMVRVQFADVPVAIEIPAGQVEQLYGRDLTLTNVRDAALVLSDTKNLHSEITLTNISCTGVPLFCGSDLAVRAPAENYVVDHFALGLAIGADSRERGVELNHRERALAKPPAPIPTDVPALPPMNEWVNVHTVGVKGDGVTDDTDALEAAIARHRTLYLPTGTYLVSRPLTLRPDTVIVGLNPGTTQIALADGTRAFAGEGEPIGVLSAPRGGTNIVSSISIATGFRNPRAAGVVWMAGAKSLLDDASFPVGRPWERWRAGQASSTSPSAAAAKPIVHPARANPQGPDILVTEGGGGVFRGNWAHNTTSRLGLCVEDTTTPGRIYQMSVEHHWRLELRFRRVANWEISALQTEEENPAGAEAYALDVNDSEHLLFANTYLYRVSRNVRPKTYAAVVHDSNAIEFENVKVFSQTRLAFDNAVFNQTANAAVRSHYFTNYVANRGTVAPAPEPVPAVFGRDAKLEPLATGFSNASGLTVAGRGEVFFTDAAEHRIYRWNGEARKAELWATIPDQPMVLGFVPPNHLLAITYEQAVYRLDSDRASPVERLREVPAPRPDTTLLLPVGLHNELSVLNDLVEHRGYVYRRGSNTAIISVVPDEHRGYFYAPATHTAIVAGGTWRPYLQSSTLAAFAEGDTPFVTSEDDGRTYRATLVNERHLTTAVFAERGGTSVATDSEGNVYIADGQVWVYDRDGRPLGALEVPERPGSLAFGGSDRRTLFIGARSSLYAIRIKPSDR